MVSKHLLREILKSIFLLHPELEIKHVNVQTRQTEWQNALQNDSSKALKQGHRTTPTIRSPQTMTLKHRLENVTKLGMLNQNLLAVAISFFVFLRFLVVPKPFLSGQPRMLSETFSLVKIHHWDQRAETGPHICSSQNKDPDCSGDVPVLNEVKNHR